MISKKIALEILNISLSTGGDFAEIYLEDGHTDIISMDNGIVEETTSNNFYGAGIRILKGLKSVYGYTSDLSKKSLVKLADSLSKSFQGERALTVEEIKKVRVSKKHQPKVAYESVAKEDKIALMKKASDEMLNYSELIVRSVVNLMERTKEVEIYNSDGKLFNDKRTRGRMFLISFASKDGNMETASSGPGAQKGFDFFTDEIDVAAKARSTAEIAVKMLDAKDCPSGKMPVIIGNGFGGVIFHEACGHSLEASAVSKGLSVFAGKLGTQIASSIVTAVDDGTIEGGWGSGNIDDEGNKTARNVLIKDGILNSYLIDNFNGRRMNMVGNGACRRQNYKYEPTSRMSNTFILPGKSTFEEMLSSIKTGIYAKSLGGGSVNPATGEFNFSVSEAYMIEDGKITYPVKGATLIGSGSEVLMNIDMIGNDLLRAQGMCGASSGSIPTDVGQPTIRVREITVGGTGGAIE